MNKVIISTCSLILFLSVFSCQEELSHSNVQIKEIEVLKLVEKYGLSGHIQITEDFNYNMSVEEVENILKEYVLISLDNSNLEIEIPDNIQLEIEQDDQKRMQEADEYLKQLKSAKNKNDSLNLSKEFQFTLPSQPNGSIISTLDNNYQISD